MIPEALCLIIGSSFGVQPCPTVPQRCILRNRACERYLSARSILADRRAKPRREVSTFRCTRNPFLIASLVPSSSNRWAMRWYLNHLHLQIVSTSFGSHIRGCGIGQASGGTQAWFGTGDDPLLV